MALDAMPGNLRFPLRVLCGLAILLAPFSAAVAAGILPVEVLNTQSPAGGVAQALINLYDLKPIIIGQLTFRYSTPGPLNSAVGVGLFSSAGDVSGAAVVQGSQVRIR